MMRSRDVATYYKRESAKAKVEDLSPEEIILALFEKACASLKRVTLLPMDTADSLELQAKIDLNSDFYSHANNALQIITALKEILDFEEGGALAVQLDETYTRLANSLWEATKKKDIPSIKKILLALTELKDGWKMVAEQNAEQKEQAVG
jgi:flagellin-specific chaperone FliS